MHTRKIPAILAVTLTAAVLAACGGSSRNEDTTTAAAAPAASGTDTAAAPASTAAAADPQTCPAPSRPTGPRPLGPLTTAAAEAFGAANSGVQVTVGISGTGGGFEKFCNGETDLSDASRPIKDEEKAACTQGHHVPRDPGRQRRHHRRRQQGQRLGHCLTVDQLKTMWGPDSKASSWKDIDPSFPDESLKLYGPGTDSGTFDFFTTRSTARGAPRAPTTRRPRTTT